MLFLFLPFAVASLCAQTPVRSAGLTTLAPLRDLGSVRPGVRVAESFRVVNGGPGIVHILELRPECSCLAGRASRTRLAPGETAEIRVTFDPPPQEGPVTKIMAVVTDAPAQVPVELVLKADVRADIGLSANHVSFDEMPRDAVGRAELLLDHRRGNAVRVTSLVTSAPGYLRVEPVRQGRDMVLRIFLDGRRLPGERTRGEEWVEVQAANPALSSFRIQVQWTSDPPLAVVMTPPLPPRYPHAAPLNDVSEVTP